MNDDAFHRVVWTEYSAVTTKGGKDALLVAYRLEDNEDAKEWLLSGSGRFSEWWAARCSLPVPNDAVTAVGLAAIGRVRPTGEVVLRQNGRWRNVVRSFPAGYPKELIDFVNQVKAIDPDAEVISVRM